jgi:hypothetical protein
MARREASRMIEIRPNANGHVARDLVQPGCPAQAAGCSAAARHITLADDGDELRRHDPDGVMVLSLVIALPGSAHCFRARTAAPRPAWRRQADQQACAIYCQHAALRALTAASSVTITLLISIEDFSSRSTVAEMLQPGSNGIYDSRCD